MRKLNKTWKQVVAFVLTLVLAFPTVYFNTNATDTTEDTVEPYFDLEFENGVATDAKGNNTVTSIGVGTVEKKIFEMDGNYYEVDAYNAEQHEEGSGDESFLKLQMNGIETLDQMTAWIMNGFTFEVYVWVEQVPATTEYFMGNMPSKGGVALTTRKTNPALNFQMGSSLPDTATYKYDSYHVTAFPSPNKNKNETDTYYELAQQYKSFDAGKLNHIVGMYDKETNMMSLYKNGELVGSGSYGEGDFVAGRDSDGYITPGVLGIGGTPDCVDGSLDTGTAYAIVDARIYSEALTETQVKAAYTDCVNQVKSGTQIQKPEDIEVTQLEDLSVYESLTGSAVQEIEGLPSYVYNTSGGVTFGKYDGYIDGIATDMDSKDLRTHIFSETTNIAFLSWLKSLESDGWTQYSNNIIEGKNLFATYTKGTQSVYAYYTTNNGEARIILQNNVNLENRAVDNQYTSVCEPLLTQIRLRSSVESNGMSYVIRLSDGRFIVIDGGNLEENYADAQRIYDVLQEQNQLDKITIAAWIFTHAHQDHINGAYEFLTNYKDEDIVLEEVIFNFLADYQNYVGETNDNYIGFKNLYDTLKTYWSETKIVTCHTGQEYYFADTKLEFLQSIEDLYPETTTNFENTNNTCSVFTMETSGQKILFLGDSHTVENTNILAMWGDYMKSDILQLTHHGKGGGVTALNETIDPEIIMIPASRHLVSNVEGEKNSLYYTQTQWAINNVSGKVKEVIIAGLGQRTISLPYTPAEDAEYINWNQNGYEFEEAEKTEVTIPKAYMDLDFKDNTLTNGGTADVTFTQNGGTVGTNTVYYKGEAYNVTSYRVEETSGDHILATLNDLSSADDLANLYLNGSTFEMFIALDTPAESLSGLIGNAYSGGGGLFLHNYAGTAVFQVGNGTKTGDYYNSNYSYSKNSSDRDIANVPAGKRVAHLVGTYNPETNMLQLYHNGVLVTEANYGTKEFKSMSASSSHPFNVMGIGVNAGKVSEILSATTGYTILESRIYNTCLSAEQVAASYWRDIDALNTSAEDTNMTEDEQGAAFTFLGGSLRMDYEDYEQTSLRFGYKITLPEGATLNSWGWTYTTTDSSMTKEAQGINKVVNSDGTIVANMVITGIPSNYFDLVITAKMKIEYTLNGKVYTLEETVTRERSVEEVANSILESNTATQNEKEYATNILK